jgi:Tfp pilus assembly protein PilO
MSNRRFVDVSLFRRLRALLLSLPQTDEVAQLLADINDALGKGRQKRKAVSDGEEESGGEEASNQGGTSVAVPGRTTAVDG